MSATISVRPLKPEDEGRWRQLFDAYIVFYNSQVSQPVIDLTFSRLLAAADGMVGLVAVGGDDQVIGLANLVFHRSTWSPSWYCYLEDLFVDPKARNAGAGRALIAATYAEADRRGATRTYWATQGHNAPARRLYDEVGVLTEFVQYRRP